MKLIKNMNPLKMEVPKPKEFFFSYYNQCDQNIAILRHCTGLVNSKSAS